MPVTRTASRALRRATRKRQVNIRRKRALKQALDKFKAKPGAQLLTSTQSVVDRAVKHHQIHKNKAARIKSSLSKLLHK
jgi:small subunit ribosomal protein S20